MLKAARLRALDTLRPSAVRERLLHKQREMFSRLDELLDKVEGLASHLPFSLDETRALGLSIHRELLGSIVLEARILIPALRVADAWGDARAQSLKARHRVRRAELNALLELLGRASPTSLVRDLREFVAFRQADMRHVEQNDLGANVLRDDVMGIDVDGG